MPNIMSANTEVHYFECACCSSEHVIRVVHTKNNDLYLEVQLNQNKNFFQRVVAAFKYIFGYECRYGHWDTTLFEKDEVKRLIQLLGKVVE